MSHKKSPSTVNWLQEVDEWAREQERAQTWLQHPYFIFLRYPKLRPNDDRQMLLTIRGCARSILARIEDLGVLDGMTDDQRLEFGALVFDLDADWAEERVSRKTRKEVALASKEVERRGRVLSRRIGKVARALNELAEYVEKLEISERKEKRPVYSSLIRRKVPQSKALRELVKRVLAWQPETTLQNLRTSFPDEPSREIAGKAAERLHAYLREAGGCSRAEADIRTAKIGNEMWDWGVHVRERYGGEDLWRGAQAVRHRRSRRELKKAK